VANFYASGRGGIGQYAALFLRSSPATPAYVSPVITSQGVWVTDPQGVWLIDHVTFDSYDLGFGPSATGPWTMVPQPTGAVSLFVAPY
jgi:hypothetical protein